MWNVKKLACVAGAAILAGSSVVRAAAPTASELSIKPIYADAAPRTPTMELMDKAGVGSTMDSNNLSAGGYAEASWTYNFATPDDGANVGRVFDPKDQDPTLNQIGLWIQRSVDASKGKFDIGGKIEAIYGSDAKFIHSNGLNFYGGDSPQAHPDEQIDLVQAYVTLAFPVGNGLSVNVGKFVTPLGYEVINPTGNALFSHSYLFGFAIPFTNTGINATYVINDQWTVNGGVVLGWDQALNNNNDSVSFLGGATWTISPKMALITNVITGPEQPDDNSDYRTVFDATFTYQLADNVKVAVNGDYGWEAGAGIDGGSATWFGAAGYINVGLTEMFAINGRLEYFNDEDRANFNATGSEVWEATLGVAIKPMPHDKVGAGLEIRPEIRFDYSPDDIFNDGSDSNQVTFGIDAVMSL